MADTEANDITTNSTELKWPDPTRPVINERIGAPSWGSAIEGDGQHDGGPPDGDQPSKE